jgi:peptidoglycan/xylan/chitin deacetylase (PgdA/CDA1 family)
MKNVGVLILLCLVLGTVGVYSHVYKELQYTKDMVGSAEAARDTAAKTSTSLKEQLKSTQDAKVFIEAALKHAKGQLLADKRTADATLAKVKDATAASCAGNAKALGVSRVVEIDTTGGPGFGMQHYKAYDFLQPGEVVLTFDDGPQTKYTEAILKALAAHCIKATFFPTGKQAVALPEVLRKVLQQGHTVGGHTFSHPDLARVTKKKSHDAAANELERGLSAVRMSAGAPISPFFRFPYLRDTAKLIKHLGARNIAVFSTDIDSFDFKIRSPKHLINNVLRKLKNRGKGMLLFHDIQPTTAKALPALLKRLKAGGYRIVHMKAKDALKTLPDVDKEVAKLFRGQPTASRPLSSVVRTISGTKK